MSRSLQPRAQAALATQRRATQELVHAILARADVVTVVESIVYQAPRRIAYGSDDERQFHSLLVEFAGQCVFDCARRSLRRRRRRTRDACTG